MPLYPNEMVPLQIDLATGMGRYLRQPSANPPGEPAPVPAGRTGGERIGGWAPQVRRNGVEATMTGAVGDHSGVSLVVALLAVSFEDAPAEIDVQ